MAIKTVLELYDDWETNADYAEVGSLSKAKSFVTAGIRLLNAEPHSQEHGGERVQKREIRDEIEVARRWIRLETRRASTAGAVRKLDCSTSFP